MFSSNCDRQCYSDKTQDSSVLPVGSLFQACGAATEKALLSVAHWDRRDVTHRAGLRCRFEQFSYLPWILNTLQVTPYPTNHFLRNLSSWFLLDCLHGSWTCTGLNGLACACFSFFIFLFLVTCARWSWPHSAFESTLNTSYRIIQERTRAQKNWGAQKLFCFA